MIYTPASFGANLSRMVYSISSYVDDLFDENSAMNRSIEQLEDIIHQQIYDSPLCILNTTRIEQESYGSYAKASKAVKDIFDLRRFLLEHDDFWKLHSSKQPREIHRLNKGSMLLLSTEWDVDKGYDLNYEAEVASKLPLTRIAYGTQLAQNLKRVYSAYGLITTEYVHKDVQAIISNAIEMHLFDQTNKIELVKYAIKSVYVYGDYFFNMVAPKGVPINDCVFIGNGCKKIAAEIKKKFSRDNIADMDQLHEISSCVTVLESLNYSGLIMCFVGGIKASQYKKTEKVDELDGFIYLPNKALKSGFAYIVEAKNYPNGENDAAKQLRKTCNYLDATLKTEIMKYTRCACLKISQKA